MPKPVTDPALLAALEGGGAPVSDPALLAQLEGFDQFAGMDKAIADKGRGPVDKLLGLTGERYQTWPERAVREVAGTPKELMDAAASAPAGSRELTENLVVPSTKAAALSVPMNPAARAGDAAFPGVVRGANMRTKPAQAPTAEALKEAAEAGYSSAREMGVEIAPSAVRDFGVAARAELEKDGIDGVLAPKTFSILAKLETPPEGAVATLANLETLRRALGHAAGDFTNKTEQLAATRSIQRLDEHLAKLGPESVLAGPASEAGRVLADARGNYASASRSERITGAEERAELNASVANSGLNVDNQIRQRIAALLKSPKQLRGFSKGEIEQLERAAKGTTPANATRIVGNLLGGGGGMWAALLGGGAGYATGGPGALLPLAGYGARKAGEKMTRRQVDLADELVRKRSPLYQSAPTTEVPMSEARRTALARLLMMTQAESQQ